MIVLDPQAPPWAQKFRLSIDETVQGLARPQSPVRTGVFAAVSALPSAASWPYTIATCLNVGGGVKALVWSDGTNWYPVTVGGAL